jgi:hypothetical protein
MTLKKLLNTVVFRADVKQLWIRLHQARFQNCEHFLKLTKKIMAQYFRPELEIHQKTSAAQNRTKLESSSMFCIFVVF